MVAKGKQRIGNSEAPLENLSHDAVLGEVSKTSLRLLRPRLKALRPCD